MIRRLDSMLWSPGADPSAGEWARGPRRDRRGAQERHPPQHAEPGPIPDELIDALFDRELDAARTEDLLRRARREPARRAEVEAAAEAIRLLRRPLETPDFTGRVLAEVDRRRMFLPARLRRMVTTTRLAVAASLVLGVGVVALIDRASPDALRFAPRPSPLTNLYETARAESPEGLRELAADVTAPVEAIASGLLGGDPERGALRVASGEHAAPPPSAQALGLGGIPSDRAYRNPLTQMDPRLLVAGMEGAAAPGFGAAPAPRAPGLGWTPPQGAAAPSPRTHGDAWTVGATRAAHGHRPWMGDHGAPVVVLPGGRFRSALPLSVEPGGVDPLLPILERRGSW